MFKKGDLVMEKLCKGSISPGVVKRAARDGSWVDVRWGGFGPNGWNKRMRAEHLLPFVYSLYMWEEKKG